VFYILSFFISYQNITYRIMSTRKFESSYSKIQKKRRIETLIA